MAWASKKQYAILMSSEEGKDLAEQLGEMEQEEFNKKFSELLGKNEQSTTDNNSTDNKDKEKQKWLEENGYESEDEVDWWEKDEYLSAYELDEDGKLIEKRDDDDDYYEPEWDLTDEEYNEYLKNNLSTLEKKELKSKIDIAVDYFKNGFKVSSPKEFNEARKILEKQGLSAMYNDKTGYVKIVYK